MANQILLKRSAVATKVPLTTDLAFGELGVNTWDGKAYMKTNQGGGDSIVDLTANQNITVSGDVSGSGTTAITLNLPTTGVVAGTYGGSATQETSFTVDAKGRITATGVPVTITPAFTSITGKPTTLAGYGITDALTTSYAPTWASLTGKPTTLAGYGITDSVNSSLLGAANGVAQLDATGKVPTSQLPSSVLGGMNYQGTWNATTNSPALANGTGTKGYYYKVATAGATSIDGNTNWTVGDLIVFDGTTWDKVEGGSADVTSVFGRVGAVTLNSADVTTALTFTPYNATNPSGYISANQSISVTGDATGTGATAIALTLANTAVTPGTYNGSATQVTSFTVDGKGRITGTGAPVTITPAFASLTGKPTTLAGYGITDAAALSSTTPSALGTAAVGVGTTSARADHVHAMPGVDNLSNVVITTKATNDLIQWNGTNWVNKTIAGAGLQPAGSYITGNQTVTLSGDATGSGATAIAVTLADTAVTPGAGYNQFTVDSKGRVTAAATLAYLTANQNITYTGDATGSGTTSVALTLANSGATAGSYGSATATPTITVDAKGRITTVGSANITPAGIGAVATTALGAASGVATLDAGGKLTTAQIPASLVGGMNYQGTWNASTNTPALASGSGTKGFYYKVSVAGNTVIDTMGNWTVGDLIAYNGATWDKVEGGGSDVSSVFGRVGAVTLTSADVTTALSFTPYNATNPSGYISANQSITYTGDATGSGSTSVALTLANSGVTLGTYNNSATAVTPFTVDAKGRITGTGGAVTITPAWGSITGKPTTLAGYAITDAMTVGQSIDGGTF